LKKVEELNELKKDRRKLKKLKERMHEVEMPLLSLAIFIWKMILTAHLVPLAILLLLQDSK
jgi:hypothetical protein